MGKKLAAIILLTFSANNAYAFLDALEDKDTQNNLMNAVTDSVKSSTNHAVPVTDLLTNGLSVTPEQATAGSGALLSLAQSQLSSADLSELESLIPWSSTLPDTQGLLGSVENMQAVQNVFESVGLDPTMIGKFAPIIMGYLGENGASDGLLNSLSSLWKNK
ncbi:hypothetical protein DZ860_07575 [Vibrio sinensis]|uniref:DUF2780 domain-containing protein n=1 Tax=Vibrio sinensis TaxID=2302434 RepID=A0A3A6R5J4_9VIBR|nr:DUF2780 domain-containing protein [Vibrio sinensis]RJX72262.1 hypothetical protein DZ860_07575 [Vibrio sinensis]